MKIIVAGSRILTHYDYVCKIIDHYTKNLENFEIVSGCARGVDTLAIKYAKDRNITLHEFPADWDMLGKKAGHLRNAQMANFADALIAIWDGQSRGTKNMIETAKKKGLRIRVVTFNENKIWPTRI